MKLSYKNRVIILLAIAFIFIGFGFFQMIFKIKINEEVIRYGQTGLFILAGIIYFNGRKKEDTDTDAKEDEDEAGDEINK
jgi:hypothetical protein